MKRRFPSPVLIYASLLVLVLTSCSKHGHFIKNDFEQVNLVSDINTLGAAHLDPALINAWGIAVAPSGPIWVASNNGGVSTIYDKNGLTLRPPVSIPAPGSSGGGAPTGIVFNPTADFAITNGKITQPSKFLFATEDGTLVGWGGGSSGTIVTDQSAFQAVYKGLAMGQDKGANFLYATNFKQAKIDVFDKNFQLVGGKSFKDPHVPAGFAPFNIRNIDGWLYVTYAKQKAPENHDDLAGPGNGIINVFGTDGSFKKRLVTGGVLNSPWAIVAAGPSFCKADHPILVGNFGDGRINIFGDEGEFIAPLKDEKGPVTIDGLWALENNVPGANPNKLFFTAGPIKETHGLFGYLEMEHH